MDESPNPWGSEDPWQSENGAAIPKPSSSGPPPSPPVSPLVMPDAVLPEPPASKPKDPTAHEDVAGDYTESSKQLGTEKGVIERPAPVSQTSSSSSPQNSGPAEHSSKNNPDFLDPLTIVTGAPPASVISPPAPATSPPAKVDVPAPTAAKELTKVIDPLQDSKPATSRTGQKPDSSNPLVQTQSTHSSLDDADRHKRNSPPAYHGGIADTKISCFDARIFCGPSFCSTCGTCCCPSSSTTTVTCARDCARNHIITRRGTSFCCSR
ncbi:hypothetical protein M427DRAFT_429076 [Gonapodya prolifera JEL478]|uniref:Uncharacterized protein n=1 Tax=Gonapodya prolifera (strain JEL478) TaxID=1344416 RepID=A0A139ASN2_GONPJ|nr:hypothetical protein M427DRAFT_429076 [Gonapodya prolifera JEL478]|eukprot:KXS19750.1 hypothetical protein M427DRAFT_429076 [Gonapodya prolifera JEL478]